MAGAAGVAWEAFLSLDLCPGSRRHLCLEGRKPLPGLTLKKVMVAPSFTAPYSIFVCFAKSSAESMGDSILSTVRKAARLAV